MTKAALSSYKLYKKLFIVYLRKYWLLTAINFFDPLPMICICQRNWYSLNSISQLLYFFEFHHHFYFRAFIQTKYWKISWYFGCLWNLTNSILMHNLLDPFSWIFLEKDAVSWLLHLRAQNRLFMAKSALAHLTRILSHIDRHLNQY